MQRIRTDFFCRHEGSNVRTFTDNGFYVHVNWSVRPCISNRKLVNNDCTRNCKHSFGSHSPFVQGCTDREHFRNRSGLIRLNGCVVSRCKNRRACSITTHVRHGIHLPRCCVHHDCSAAFGAELTDAIKKSCVRLELNVLVKSQDNVIAWNWSNGSALCSGNRSAILVNFTNTFAVNPSKNLVELFLKTRCSKSIRICSPDNSASDSTFHLSNRFPVGVHARKSEVKKCLGVFLSQASCDVAEL